MTTKKDQLMNAIENEKARSCWNQGVKIQALEMVESLTNSDIEKLSMSTMAETVAFLRNGADSWKDYSYGGCALIYDPEAREEWLDVQARGCAQAAGLIYRTLRHIVFI